MIEVQCVVLSGKANWKIRAPSAEQPEDLVRLSFNTADFFTLSQRDAYQRIRSVLRREGTGWIEPSLEAWRIRLERLAELIARPRDLPWLKGTVVLKPEIKSDSRVAAKQEVANVEFVFYLSAETIKETEKSGPMMRNQLFISYSHRDKAWLDRLRVHLRPLERHGLIELFDDSKIKPGARWRDEIRAALDKAKVAILLVSADFLASDFIAEDELPPLLKKAQAGGAKILPLIVSACRFHREKSLSEYQAVNDPKKPLASLTPAESEQVLATVSEAVEEALGINRTECGRNEHSAFPAKDENATAELQGESAKELLRLIAEERDPNLKGLTEICDSPEPGQIMFIASLATHAHANVYKMKSRLFREGIAELLEKNRLYPPEKGNGTLFYELRTQDRLPLAQRVIGESNPFPPIPFAIPVPDKPSLVESPFQPGRYFNVSGFTHGDHVRDPYTDRVCIIP